MTRSPAQERGGLGGLRGIEEASAVGAFDAARAARMNSDVAGEPLAWPRSCVAITIFTPDAATVADDVLDRLGGGRIEARGRLVEKQHLRIARERARQREALLLAAREPARGPVARACVSPTRASSSAMRRVARRAATPAATARSAMFAGAERRSITGRWNTMRAGVAALSARPPHVSGRGVGAHQPLRAGAACSCPSRWPDQHGRRAGADGRA